MDSITSIRIFCPACEIEMAVVDCLCDADCGIEPDEGKLRCYQCGGLVEEAV